LQLSGVELSAQPYDYEQALRETADDRSALLVMSSPVFFNDRKRLAEFALRHKLPAAFGQREFVDVGGLLSYGPDSIASFRRVAEYVYRIAKGARPADLPVEQPTKFQLVINLKTAKALGLTIPQIPAGRHRRGDRMSPLGASQESGIGPQAKWRHASSRSAQ
jgi:putative ABC transport system substrate-binding protein